MRGSEGQFGPNANRRWMIAATLFVVAACTTTAAVPAWEPLKSDVAALYLNHRELKRLHSDLHAAARAHIEAQGGQLAEIQSAARFIQQANLIAFYQWELLSITEYIRESARHDFMTLRIRSLIDARDRSNDLIMATRVYEAFIRDPHALQLIGTCIDHIEKNRELYLKMVHELENLAGSVSPRDDNTAGKHDQAI
jgi:hypothetical protein